MNDVNYNATKHKQSLKFTKRELQSEIWKLITWSNGTYYVSNLGRVKKLYKHKYRILIPYFKLNAKGTGSRRTLFVKIFIDNKTDLKSNKRKYKQVTVHQLVAEFFLPGKLNNDYVLYHSNGVISDNRAFNLKWITKKELGRITGGKTKKTKGINKVDPGTNKVIDFYKTSRQAAKENYCSYQTILDSCNGKTKKNCTGYIYRWSTSTRMDYSWD